VTTTPPDERRRPARRKARKRALDVLFEAEQRNLIPMNLLAQRLAVSGSQTPLPQYSVTLVEGVAEHLERIDEIIATYSQGWTVDRMASVDRAALRIGVYELLWQEDVPDAVAISEAVEMVTELSSDEAPSFVNGLLGRVLRMKDTLVD